MAKGHGAVIPAGAYAPAFREPLVAAVILALAAGLALFVVLPLMVVFKAAGPIEGSSYLNPLWNSLKIGASVACTGTLVGYALAYVTTMTGLPFRRFFTSIGTLPMIAPPFMMALAAIMLFGHNGFVSRNLVQLPSIYGFWGLLLVETISYFPTAFLLLIAVFQAIDPVLLESARNQGAGPVRVFKDIVFPLSIPGIISSMLLIFIESLADFGNPLILSGDYKVLSVEAYLKITGEFDQAGGASLAILLLVPSIAAFMLQKYVVDRRSFATLTGKPSSSSRAKSGPVARALALGVASLVAAVVILFYAAVGFGSLVQTWGANHTFTFSNYATALDRSWGALYDSLILALISAPITGLVGMLMAYLLVRKSFAGRGLMEFVSMLTFAVPGTVVGIGYVLAFNQPPIQLTGTAAIIVILMIFRNLPLGIQSGMAAIRQVDRAIEEGSANLGAGSMTTFRKVVLPLIAPALFSGLAQSFVRAMTAISAIIFVVSGQWNLITVSILGYVENSQLSQASALSITLVVFVSAVL
ncbi:MAG TPA: iron ABC transporter permease, partial [Bdellovibrionota bacterium]|nr:iron ABC transporter permease [Bdellovibrionota bacterium]